MGRSLVRRPRLPSGLFHEMSSSPRLSVLASVPPYVASSGGVRRPSGTLPTLSWPWSAPTTWYTPRVPSLQLALQTAEPGWVPNVALLIYAARGHCEVWYFLGPQVASLMSQSEPAMWQSLSSSYGM